MKAKAYLGDSVYAEWSGEMVKLTTDNGLGPTNTIFLEPEVMDALILWAQIPEGEKT